MVCSLRLASRALRALRSAHYAARRNSGVTQSCGEDFNSRLQHELASPELLVCHYNTLYAVK
jgi:hypothetical protein